MRIDCSGCGKKHNNEAKKSECLKRTAARAQPILASIHQRSRAAKTMAQYLYDQQRENAIGGTQ
jgi:hypothetical protein